MAMPISPITTPKITPTITHAPWRCQNEARVRWRGAFISTNSAPAASSCVSRALNSIGVASGASFAFGSAFAATAPAILGWIATHYSIGAGLPLVAASFFLLGLFFLFIAPETTRKELVDFVGEKVV